MNGAFGQMGGAMPGGPGQMGAPPQLGGPAPQGTPMGDPNLGGQAVFAGPPGGGQGQPMGGPPPGYAGPPARTGMGNPLAQWIPSFTGIMARVDSMARAIPWWVWLGLGIGAVLLFKSDSWFSKVKRWVAKSLSS